MNKDHVYGRNNWQTVNKGCAFTLQILPHSERVKY